MVWPRGLAVLLVTGALVAAAIAAAPAQAAKRQVPFGFFGTVLGNSQASSISDAELDAQMAKMARSGVESVRFGFQWSTAEPERGTYDFALYDRVVAAAARHGMGILPIVHETPRWASPRPRHDDFRLWAPRNPRSYAGFMRVLIRRYGPRGSFWARSGSPKVPIRTWMVWNEPAADFFFASRPWARSYVRLLRPAYRAIKATDRGATVLLGSVAGVSGSDPWGQVRAMYRAGAKGYFDAIPVHFFSSASTVRVTTTQTLELVRLLHNEVRRAGDRKRRLWFTELTWTAAQGRIPRSELRGFETTPRGQAARLKAVFSRLAGERKRLRIGPIYWYSWASEYVPQLVGGAGAVTFQYAGLNKIEDGNFTSMPLLRTYTETVARFAGCRKTSNARRCR
jgi:polysaccharide biosynthesis protein PslG